MVAPPVPRSGMLPRGTGTLSSCEVFQENISRRVDKIPWASAAPQIPLAGSPLRSGPLVRFKVRLHDHKRANAIRRRLRLTRMGFRHHFRW